MSFGGKRALVTGAGSGIGAATARSLAHAGAEVIVADLAPHGVADELGAVALELDVRDESQVAEAMHDLDVLVNAAGIGSTTNGPETPLEVWENVLAVNARGLLAGRRWRHVMLDVGVEAGRDQAIADRGEALRAFRMVGTHVMLAARRVRDVRGRHGL